MSLLKQPLSLPTPLDVKPMTPTPNPMIPPSLETATDLPASVTGNKPPFTTLDIELTERCNFCCPHCWIRRSTGNYGLAERECSFEFYERILSEAKALGCLNVRFTGGEPLLRKDFAQIYMLAIRLGLKTRVTTNAVLITVDIAAMFAQNPPEIVTISLYGWDEESWNTATQTTGMFPRFIEAISQLREKNVPFRLQYPPTKFHVANREKLSEFAKNLGFTDPLPYAWKLSLHGRGDCAANASIRKLRMDPVEAVKQKMADGENTKHDLALLKKQRTGQQPEKLFPCRKAIDRVTIDAYGQLQICLEVRHPDTLYDLRTGSFQHAIENHLPKFKDMVCTNRRYLSRCARCALKNACSQCPGTSWTASQTLDTPDEYICAVLHREAEILGVIPPGQKGWIKPKTGLRGYLQRLLARI